MKVKNILVSQNAPAEFEKSPYFELTKKYSVNIFVFSNNDCSGFFQF